MQAKMEFNEDAKVEQKDDTKLLALTTDLSNIKHTFDQKKPS